MITIEPTERLDRAISYGESCFETVAVINGRIFDWPRHLQRLQLGAEQLAITLTERDLARITKAAYDAVFAAVSDAPSVLRLTLTPGEADWGIIAPGESPRLFIQILPKRVPSPAQLLSMAHPCGDCVVCAKFSGDYGMMLRHGGRDILQQGATPLLWHHDRICGAATANVALHVAGQWFTPATEAGGVLPGIIRHHLLKSGVMRACCCDRTLLSRCDGMALLNSGALVQKVASVDGRVFAQHGATERLAEVLHGLMQREVR